MKNNFLLSWIITIIFSFITKDLNAQATTAGSGNSPANPNVEYLGWTLLTNEVVNVKNEDNLEIHFYTNSGFNTLNNRKMNIGSRSLNSLEHAGVGIQSIGVSPITRLRSILHLGNNSVAGIAGWRAWEDVGTFCGKGSDYAYFGTMTDNYDSTIVAGDNNDAVIVWGDNLFGANDGADHLRIIFNAPMNFSTGTASFYSGLEIARYSPIGRMGIGNFSVTAAGAGSGINPHRRLEIYGENNDALLNAAAPQLRLTHTPNANVDLGINTDFETTSLGDLFINTRSAGVFRNVGINTSTPQATLEINSNFPSTSSQSSGLMFSDLRPTSPNGITSYGKVLTVDAAGLVVLTDDNGGNGSVTACSSLPTDVDFLTKWSTITTGGTREICRTSGVYELPTLPNTVGIGVGSSPDPAFKLHMKGDLLIERDAGNTTGNIYMRNGSGTQRVFVQYGLFGMRSLAIGANAGPASLATASADGCIYIGNESGRLTTSNWFNTFLGYRSGYNIGNIDNSNTFIGGQSAFNMTGGNDNLIQGFNSALSVIRGERNVMLGSKTVAFGMSSGNDNITIGAGSSLIETTSNQNIIIGSNAQGRDFNFPGALTNAVTIGNLGMVDCSNCFTIGSQNPFTSPEQQVGIGYRNPAITVIPPPPLPLAPPPPPASPAKLYVSNFNGGTTSAFLNGDVYTPAMYFPSDSALKTNIQTYSNALQVITSLEVKSYEFNHSAFPSMVLPSGHQVGIMATNINSLAPQLVRMFSNPIEYDTTGNIINPQVDFAAVNYTGIIPYLVSAIKEQKHTIDSLISVVSLCCPAPDIPDPSNRNQSSIKLSNSSSIILNQNVPNPFRDKTEITYEIPTDVNKAAILFYDASGKILNTFEITGSGSGTLTVYGDDLSSGIYTYTLIVDGKPIQTKKMFKE